MPASAPLRVAVVGCGRVSRGHVRGWVDEPERARIVALVDVEPRFAEERRDQFDLREARIFTDYRDVLARDDVDVVDLCTRSHLHGEQIIAALEAGKHVLTEKPAGYTLEECRHLRWYARRYPHLKVGVGYSLRYWPLNIRVRELLREGAIGRVLSIEAAHNHPYDPAFLGPDGAEEVDEPVGTRVASDSSGHYLPSSELAAATHVFDFMRYFGGEVRDVFAFRERAGTFALLRFHSGAIGTATAGFASKEGLATPHVLSVQGTEGTLFTQSRRGADAWGVDTYHGYIVTRGEQRPIDVDATGSTGAGHNLHGDTNRTRNLIDAIQDGAPLIASLEDAIGTSELLHAVRDSHDHEIRVPVHRATKTG